MFQCQLNPIRKSIGLMTSQVVLQKGAIDVALAQSAFATLPLAKWRLRQMAAATNGTWDTWRLGHLACGTNGI